MVTGNSLDGKPYAGNLRLTATPRHGALPYLIKKMKHKKNVVLVNVAQYLPRVMAIIVVLLSMRVMEGAVVNTWKDGNLTWKLSSTPLSSAQFGGDYTDIAHDKATINRISS